MMKKPIVLFCLLVTNLLNIQAQPGGALHNTPYSQITASENGEYEFVLLSDQNLDKYEKDALLNWKEAGFSKSEISKLADNLRIELRKEKNLRRKYIKSGLFATNNVGGPLFQVRDFSPDIDLILVANDGSFVVGLNSFVTILNIASSPLKSDLVKTPQKGLIVLRKNGEACSLKFADLLTENDKFGITSEGFFWTEGKSFLKGPTNTIEVTKLNGEALLFDVNNCKVSLKSDLTTSAGNTPQDRTNCSGLALVAGLWALCILRGPI